MTDAFRARRATVLLTALCATTLTSYAAAEDDYPRGRLDETVEPLHYDLELTVLPDQASFDGRVDITVRLRAPARRIFLHGRALVVHRAGVATQGGERFDARYRQLSDDGVAVLDLGRELAPQTLQLSFEYSAPFGRRLHGLYRVDEGGRSYAFTQLQSIYAREMFPGFDQPSWRTPFEVTLNVRPEDVAISSAPEVENSLRDDGLRRVRFAPTAPIPTYLLAVAVGEFDVIEGEPIPPGPVRDRPIPFRGIAVHGKGELLEHAMRTTADILAPFEDYFDLPFPFAKLDILAVPDFEAGAMENVGAITFRENLLLLPEDASVRQRQSYTSVMAHELAHMWFGNLVTMPWWDDIWLSEAFATWMSYKAVAAYDPDQRPDLRRLQRLRRAKEEDALDSARRIREPVVDSHDIIAAFDSITYAKGAAVLNMFEQFLGEETMRRAIRGHLRRYALGNATVDDFVAAIESVSDEAVGEAFRSFLTQRGLPRVDVALDCDAGRVRVRQSRFLPRGSRGESDAVWGLPLCMRYGAAGEVHRQCVLIDQAVATFALEHAGCPDWLMPDADYAGYYQWNLTPRDYARLRNADPPLSEAEWLSVADSTQSALAAGALDVGAAWDALAPLAGSPYPAVALAPSRLLVWLLEHYADEPRVRVALRAEATRLYARRDAGGALQPGFLEGLASDQDRVFHLRLLEFMALDAEEPALRARARELVGEALGEAGFVEGVLARGALQTALTVAVQDGDAATRERILEALLASRDATFRNAALKALAATRDPAFGARVRSLALGDALRSNEIRTLLQAHFDEPTNRPPAWRWLVENWPRLAKSMPPRHAAMAPTFVTGFCDEAMATKVAELFGPGQDTLPGGPRYLAKAVETMTLCGRRVAAERSEVRARFRPGVTR